MRCPFCGNIVSKVLNSRPVNDEQSIRRRRQCEKCNRRFTTYEMVENIPFMVVKRDQTREVFDREKLFKGILRSCNKRNIPMDKIENLVDKIESDLLEGEEKEISSIQIGEITMRYLRDIDEVSYIRFASVYKQFMCVEEFIAELENMKKLKDKRGV